MPTTSHRKFKHPSLVAAAAAAMNCLIERKIDRKRHQQPRLRPQAPATTGPHPALRPIRTALRAATAGADAALLSVTDRLVDAIDTLDAILRANLAPL